MNTAKLADAKSAGSETASPRYVVWPQFEAGLWVCWDQIGQQVVCSGEESECRRYAAQANNQLEMPLLSQSPDG